MVNCMGHELLLEAVNLADGQILADSVRQYRANCMLGRFSINANDLQGDQLDMEIIGAQISEGEYFGYCHQKWLQIIFVDCPEGTGHGVMSSILFKTESLDNFAELRTQYFVKGESLLGKTIRATMSKRASKSGNGYFAVQFSVVSDGKYAEAISQFRKLHYSPTLFRQLEGPTQSSDIKENGNPPVKNNNRNSPKGK